MSLITQIAHTFIYSTGYHDHYKGLDKILWIFTHAFTRMLLLMKMMKYLAKLHAKEQKTVQPVKWPCGNTFSTSTVQYIYNAEPDHQVSLQSAINCGRSLLHKLFLTLTNQPAMLAPMYPLLNYIWGRYNKCIVKGMWHVSW